MPPSGRRIIVWVQWLNDRPHPLLQWHDPVTGKRRSRSAGTADPREIEARRCDLESDLNNARHVAGAPLSWKEFRASFEAERLAPLRPDTRRLYAYSLDLFERHAAPARLDLVSARVLSGFVSKLRTVPKRRGGEGMAESSIATCLTHLRAALGWAAEQELIPKVPRFPKAVVPGRRPQPVPAEAVEKLLAKAPDGQWRTFLLTGWLAGLRLEEAVLLERGPTDSAPWVDWGADKVRLPAGFAKSGRDEWVPLDAGLKAALEALPGEGRRVFCLRGTRGRRVADASVSALVCKLARRAGVRLSMHTLRKGFGCRYAGKVPAQVLQRLMRHSSVTVTMQFYCNIDAAVEEAVLGEKNKEAPERAEGL